MKRSSTIPLVIGAATILVYLPALQNGFVTWDDGLYVFDNPALGALDLRLLRFAVGFETPNWHPLTWIVHGLEHALWGLRPVGHHATSILLHAANAVLLYRVVLGLLEASRGLSSEGEAARDPRDVRFDVLAAAAAGLLFGIHPMHVESVAWASGKKDLLCTLFVLLAVRAYTARARSEAGGGGAAARGGTATKALLASTGWFALALLSKPSAVTFPAVLLLLDVYPLRRVRATGMARLVLEKVPFLALGPAMAAVTYVAHDKAGDVANLEAVGISTRLFVSVSSVVSYLGHVFWPVGLLPFYPYPEIGSVTALASVPFVAAFVAITLVCILLVRRWPVLAAAWVYFLVTLVPVIGLVKMGFQARADRYAYLPSVGPIVLIGVGVALLARRAGSWAGVPKLAIASTAVAVVSLSYLTSSLTRIWRDDESLWSYEIETAPGLSWLAYQNRGVALSRLGRYDAALEDYIRATEMNPRSAELFFNRGNALARLGRYPEAVRDYTAAISLAAPPHPDYFENRGAVLAWIGRQAEAAADLREAERARALQPERPGYPPRVPRPGGPR